METPVTAAALAKDILGCDVETVYRMARDRTIPSFKIGRFYRFHPTAVLERLSAPPASWSQSNRSRGRKRAAA